MNIIREIYRVQYMKDKFSYIGTLRNEKLFSINEKVFFTIDGHDIFYGRIIGIELPPAENPDYKYKIELPAAIVESRMKSGRYDEKDSDIGTVILTCRDIFYSAIDAKRAALKNLKNMYELQLREIENYFSQFDENTK